MNTPRALVPFSLVALCMALAPNGRSDSITIGPAETISITGGGSAGANSYDVQGGVTTIQHKGPSQSSLLFRTEGGTLAFYGTSTGGNATAVSHGGPGNGGRFATVTFHDDSTAGAISVTNKAGVLGPNFDELSPGSIDGWGGQTQFHENAKAGSGSFINEGESFFGGTGGITAFSDHASADHGAFVTLGASHDKGLGGEVYFEGHATAGSGSFTNHPSATTAATDFAQGRTVFFETSDAGSATILNKAGDSVTTLNGGTTEFRNSSNAGQSSIVNEGAATRYWNHGATQFFNSASAEQSTIVNRQGGTSGGLTEFFDQSTAGSAHLINDGSQLFSAYGGEIIFHDQSSAGNATLQNVGPYGGSIWFKGNSTADHATLLLDSRAYNSQVYFAENSTAANATIEVSSNALLLFQENASAGNANVALRANLPADVGIQGGGTGSFRNGTAGNATFTVWGAEVAGATRAGLFFEGPTTTAGNATIIVNGAQVTTYGATGGLLSFDYNSHAGSATIVVNSGSNGGAGGLATFGRGSQGDQARIILNGTGALDVGANGAMGTTIGSLEGDGSVYLRGALLVVGSRNTDTDFNGVIAEGIGYSGGALTKTGSGRLALNGANTYTGLTTVNSGILAINGSVLGDVLVNAGGTLKGTGTIGGTVTVAPGGIFSPGNSPGTIAVGNLILGPGSALNLELGTISDFIDIRGDFILGGVLNLFDSGGFSPNHEYDLFRWGGAFTNLGFTIGLTPDGYSASDFSFDFSNGRLRLLVGDVIAPPPPVDPNPPGPSAVPEPSTYGAIAAAALLMLAVLRRIVRARP